MRFLLAEVVLVLANRFFDPVFSLLTGRLDLSLEFLVFKLLLLVQLLLCELFLLQQFIGRLSIDVHSARLGPLAFVYLLLELLRIMDQLCLLCAEVSGGFCHEGVNFLFLFLFGLGGVRLGNDLP